MVVIKYYCDCCKREVAGAKNLISISIFSEFKFMQDSDNPYENKDICEENVIAE